MNTLTLKRAREAYWFEEHCCDEFKADYRAEADAMVVISLTLAYGNPQAFERWLTTRNV